MFQVMFAFEKIFCVEEDGFYFCRLEMRFNANCSELWIVNFFFEISGPIARHGVARLFLREMGSGSWAAG